VYHKESNGLQRIKEARPRPVLKEIPMDITRGAIAFFLNEILYKVLGGQSPDSFLFNFIQQSVIWLDETDKPLPNHHLVFLIKLRRFCGFLPLYYPQELYAYFHLNKRVFSDNLAPHYQVL